MAELCVGVFATCLRSYSGMHCQIQVDYWTHFTDSPMEAGSRRTAIAIKRSFQNEWMQKVGPADDWKWVERKLNIADFITRSTTPEDLAESPAWQENRSFRQDSRIGLASENCQLPKHLTWEKHIRSYPNPVQIQSKQCQQQNKFWHETFLK